MILAHPDIHNAVVRTAKALHTMDKTVHIKFQVRYKYIQFLVGTTSTVPSATVAEYQLMSMAKELRASLVEHHCKLITYFFEYNYLVLSFFHSHNCHIGKTNRVVNSRIEQEFKPIRTSKEMCIVISVCLRL